MEPRTFEISGSSYTISPLAFGQWRSLHVAVWPVVLPVLAMYLERRDDDHAWTLERVVRMVAAMLPLHEQAYQRTVSVLATATRVEGQAATLDKIAEVWWPRQGYQGLAGWIAAGLEVQLVPFLSGMSLDDLGPLAALGGEPSVSPTTSTG